MLGQTKCQGYEICSWDNDNIKQYIDEVIDRIGEIPKGSFSFVGDICRLLILRDHGGIYLDHDVEIFRSFDHALDADSIVTFQYPESDNPPCFKRGVTMRQVVQHGITNGFGTLNPEFYLGEFNGGLFINRDDYINNCFIASVPNSKLVNTAIELWFENYQKPNHEKYAMSDWSFGPQVVTHAAEKLGICLNGKTQKVDDVLAMSRKPFHALHGSERLVNKQEFFDALEKLRNDPECFTFHHHVFTNMDSYAASVFDDEIFYKHAHAFVMWFKEYYNA